MATIEDFGEQWTRYRDNAGYYGSLALFRDMFEPLLSPEEVRGKRVADLGSGTGRIVRMLVEAGAERVLAVEPSAAFDALVENTKDLGGRVELLRATADALPPSGALDLVVSYGVLHHIEDPRPAVRAARKALKPGGRLVFWVYGREGNGLYLALVAPLRAVTTRLPHAALEALSGLLALALAPYIALCRVLPLPLARFMREVMAKLDFEKRRLNVYDQLNPGHAKYYRRAECEALLKDAGFADVRLHHRHGYSWTASGTNPGERA